MDGRDSFIDGIEIIAQYQLFQIQEEREVWDISSFWSIRSFWRDDGWFNCWKFRLTEMLCELFVNNGIDLGNEWFSDDGFVTQWCERGVFGKGRSEFVWVGFGVVRGRGTARRNDGLPTCLFLNNEFRNFWMNEWKRKMKSTRQIDNDKNCYIFQFIEKTQKSKTKNTVSLKKNFSM